MVPTGLGSTIPKIGVARTGPYLVLIDPRDWRSGLISRADVADFFVKQPNKPSLVYETPALIG
jgi:hypothetical protein